MRISVTSERIEMEISAEELRYFMIRIPEEISPYRSLLSMIKTCADQMKAKINVAIIKIKNGTA